MGMLFRESTQAFDTSIMQSLQWIKCANNSQGRINTVFGSGQWILAFRYGARGICFGYALKWMKILHPVDMSTFLKDIAPYLPQHLQQTAMVQATAMNNPVFFVQSTDAIESAMVYNLCLHNGSKYRCRNSSKWS
jgi:hypothetical protein